MKSIIFTFITIFIGISIAVPIKDHDDLVLRVNELRRLNPYQDDLRFFIRNLDSIGGGNLLRSLNSVVDRSSSSSSSLSKDGFYGKNAIGINNENYGDGENEGNHNTFTPSFLTQRIVRSLDSIGGGNLIRALDSLGGGHLVKRTIDSLGGANLLKKK